LIHNIFPDIEKSPYDKFLTLFLTFQTFLAEKFALKLFFSKFPGKYLPLYTNQNKGSHVKIGIGNITVNFQYESSTFGPIFAKDDEEVEAIFELAKFKGAEREYKNKNGSRRTRWTFFNYVNHILPIIDLLPTNMSMPDSKHF